MEGLCEGAKFNRAAKARKDLGNFPKFHAPGD
jgi:hypothetical protein